MTMALDLDRWYLVLANSSNLPHILDTTTLDTHWTHKSSLYVVPGTRHQFNNCFGVSRIQELQTYRRYSSLKAARWDMTSISIYFAFSCLLFRSTRLSCNQVWQQSSRRKVLYWWYPWPVQHFWLPGTVIKMLLHCCIVPDGTEPRQGRNLIARRNSANCCTLETALKKRQIF